MCWLRQRQLSPDDLAPGIARTMSIDALGQRLGSADWLEPVQFDTAVIASELVTNAIQSGATELAMTVQVHRSRIRLTVSDNGPGLPRIVSTGPDDMHGRGMVLVAALAFEWGVDPSAVGKQVWADLALPPTAFAAAQLAWCEESAQVSQVSQDRTADQPATRVRSRPD